ncbi:MAG: CPBP family intramembrane metalloprotease [Bacteroidota bacterium]|nr:CPBP family intramembrane metalloprotease [Bacteroidota bacterium]
MDDSDQPVRPLFAFGPGMRAMLLVSLCFACIGIYSMLMRFVGTGEAESLNFSRLSGVVQAVLCFALPAIIYANIFPPDRFGYLRLNVPASPVKFILGAAVLVLLIFPMDWGAAMIEKTFTNKELLDYIDAIKKSSNTYMQMPDFGSFLICLVVNALVPAICEEIFFRAGLQQILSERRGFHHVAVFLSAMFFAFFHANPAALPFIFLAGLILGYAFYWTGSLRVTIVMHFLYNGTTVFLIYLAQHNAAVAAWQPGIALIISFSVVAAMCMFLFWKKTQGQRIEL